MNDIGPKLKDVFEADASHAPLATAAPASLRRRVRRRQARTALVGGSLAIAVAVASFAGATALDRRDRRVAGPEPERTRTASIAGVTISIPASWHLIDRALGQRPNDDTTLDVLEVANFDPGIGDPVCGTDLPPTGAALWLGIGGGRADAAHDELPVWPVDLTSGTSEPCGSGLQGRFLGESGGLPFTAWVGFGRDVSTADRDAMLRVVSGLAFERDLDGTVYAETPAYVIGGGTDAEGPWLLETRPTDANLEIELARPGGRSGMGDFGVPEEPIQGWAFGAVTTDAARMEFRPRDGGPIVEAKIAVPPLSFGVDFNLFFVEDPAGLPRSGTWVAIADDGTILAQHGRGGVALPPPDEPTGTPPSERVLEGPHDATADVAYWSTVEVVPDGWRLSVLVADADAGRGSADVAWTGVVPRSAVGTDGSSLNAVVVDVSQRSNRDEVIAFAFVPPGTAELYVDMEGGGGGIGLAGSPPRGAVRLQGEAGAVDLVAFATSIVGGSFGPIATVSARNEDGDPLLEAEIDWRSG
jgi:hypothetical protein